MRAQSPFATCGPRSLRRPGTPFRRGIDPGDEFMDVVFAKRQALMSSYRKRLPAPADLEDCYWQATAELWVALQRGKSFESEDHAANALELRFSSRIDDMHRARGVRERVLPGVNDSRPDAIELAAAEQRTVEEQVELGFARAVLTEVLHDLSYDERRLLVAQANGMARTEICEQFGWHIERYKSLVRRSWAKLRVLLPEAETGARCEKLEPALLAFAGDVAEEPEQQRIRAHLRTCPGCGQRVALLRRAARNVGAFVPLPLGTSGIGALLHAKILGLAAGARHRVLTISGRAPASDSGATSVAGGAVAGGGVLKAVATVCVVGVGAAGVCVSPLIKPTAHSRAPARSRAVAPKRRHAPPTAIAAAPVPAPATSITPTAPHPTTAAVSSTLPATVARSSTRRSHASPAAKEFGFEGGGSGTPPAPTASASSTQAQAASASVAPAPAAAPPAHAAPAPAASPSEFGGP